MPPPRIIQLPTFPHGELPPAEPRSRLFVTRALALATLVIAFGYLGWRILGGTVNLEVWWVSIPLIVAEIHAALGLALFTTALWSVDTPVPPRARRSSLRVAVVLPTYRESREILLPAIAAAVALQPEHETWVLDDGARPEIEELARTLGARYLARPTHEHAKAGNINHALPYIDAEVIAFLDADYVAQPAFLERTLPYFEDPRVAVVQTPQDFYNHDSFEHEAGEDGDAFYEEGVFYRVIGPGKNNWGGAFWCGTCALVRKEALLSVGGVATTSITEDIQTTLRMHRAAWTTVYHNEVLARGLAPADAAQYLSQRHRWAVGAMQVLRLENPLWGPGLTFGQRLGYAATLAAWFDSWRTVTYMLLAPVVLLTGASPIDAPGHIYAPLFLLTFLAEFFALRRLARGYYPPLLSLIFEVLRLPAVLPATLAVFAPRRDWRFVVTAKGRLGAERRRFVVPRLLLGLAALGLGSLAWYGATLAALTPTRYVEPAATHGAAAFATLNLALLGMAIRRVRASRFAGERRNSVRFPVHLEARIHGAPCEVADLSVTGAKLFIPAGLDLRGRDTVTLEVTGPDGVVTLDAAVRRRQRTEVGRDELGLEFVEGQDIALARLSLWLLARPAAEGPRPVDGGSNEESGAVRAA